MQGSRLHVAISIKRSVESPGSCELSQGFLRRQLICRGTSFVHRVCRWKQFAQVSFEDCLVHHGITYLNVR